MRNVMERKITAMLWNGVARDVYPPAACQFLVRAHKLT
jgi:hypothetical protein